MNGRDAIEMYKVFLTHDAFLKGSLQAELDAANAALDAVGGAQMASKGLQELDAAKAGFEAYKADVLAKIEAARESHNEDADKLDMKQAKLIDEQNAFDQEKADFEKAMFEANSKLSIATQQVRADQAEIAQLKDELAKEQAQLASDKAAVAAREDAVHAKLEVLKTLA